jgi:hypothetical protein
MRQPTKRETVDPVTTAADSSSTALTNRSALLADGEIVGRALDLVTSGCRVRAVVPRLSLLIRIRDEFLEKPDLRLTCEQAQRLCGVEHALCQLVLDTLVDLKFLCVTSVGVYARTTRAGTPAAEVLRHGRNDLERRAHELYCDRGCEHGHDMDHWLQAESEVRDAVNVARA